MGMRTAVFQHRLLLLAGCGVLVLQAACTRAPEAPPPPPRGIQVLAVEGRAVVDGAPLAVGQVLDWGRAVSLATESRVDLRGDDDMALRIWGPARVGLTRHPVAGPQVELHEGRVISVFDEGVTSSVRYGLATLHTRGGVLYASHTSEVPNYMCTCRGRVHAEHAHGLRARVSARDHDQPFRVMERGFEPAPMLGHSDQDVRDVLRLLRP